MVLFESLQLTSAYSASLYVHVLEYIKEHSY